MNMAPKASREEVVNSPTSAASHTDKLGGKPPLNFFEKNACVLCLRHNLVTVLTVGGVVAGICLGAILKTVKEDWSKRERYYVDYIGQLYLSMMKGIILPLIASSLITAIGSLDISMSRTIGCRGLGMYMATTVIAMMEGIFVAVVVQPGNQANTKAPDKNETQKLNLPEDNFLDLGRNLFVRNIIEATMLTFQTQIVNEEKDINVTVSPDRARTFDFKEEYVQATNIMGVIFTSLVFGIAIGKVGKNGKPFLNFFSSLMHITMVLTNWIVWLTPIGVLSLIAAQILQINDFGGTIKALAWYTGCVISAIFFHGLVVLPLIFFIFTKKLPFKFYVKMMPAVLTAFGCASSSATLPVTFTCVANNGVDDRISRFLLPIGATVNMDGIALYEAVAAIFIAQLYGVELDAGKIISLSLTAVSASIGAAAIPGSGIIAMVLVLQSVGLPSHYISYVVPMDWLLDRLVTALNVLGDGVACGVIHECCKGELKRLTLRDQQINAGFGDISNSTMNVEDEEAEEIVESKEKK